MTATSLALLTAAAVVLLLISLLVMYNRFVRQRVLCDESWGQTDVDDPRGGTKQLRIPSVGTICPPRRGSAMTRNR